jgi:hypothetical protein
MKFSVEQTTLELFERAVAYLRDRIDGTTIGRMKQAQGKHLYRDFAQYKALGEDEPETMSE